MFTVVIAEQEHIRRIEDYHTFLRPFLEKTQVTFCKWDLEGSNLNEMVPQLVRTVDRHDQWRAVIICNEQGLGTENPFDIVHCRIPKPEKDEPEEAYLERLWEVKRKAFDAAAMQPLTRLVTFLCETHMISTGKNRESAELRFFQYRKEALYKQALREKIKNGYKSEISFPAEILCIAKRTCEIQESSIQSSWTPHIDFQYTHFYDWNLYFDKMRYLIFDILSKKNKNYTFDYIRFLYVLMLIANNEIPSGSMRSQRIYRLDCENDERALQDLLNRYESKLIATDEELAHKLHELQNKERRRLSDKEAESIFCRGVTVPVSIVHGFDESELYVHGVGFSLAAENQTSDSSVWYSAYNTSLRALHRFLKQPRRALKRACEDLRNLDHADTEHVPELNAFQLEDVAEHIALEENNMVTTSTRDVVDIEPYKAQLDEASKEVEQTLRSRMTRKTVAALGALVVGLFFIGFLPLIFNNMGNIKTVGTSLVLIACNLGVMAAAEIICLIYLRTLLRKKIGNYNGAMGSLVKDVEASSSQFSKYLSHACNVMRGFSVLNRYEDFEAPEYSQARLFKKHRMDILRCREELHEVFGRYITENPLSDEPPYTYDFQRPVDFTYPIPYNEGARSEIEFIQPGNTVTVPVRFVRRITIKLEELYD